MDELEELYKTYQTKGGQLDWKRFKDSHDNDIETFNKGIAKYHLSLKKKSPKKESHSGTTQETKKPTSSLSTQKNDKLGLGEEFNKNLQGAKKGVTFNSKEEALQALNPNQAQADEFLEGQKAIQNKPNVEPLQERGEGEEFRPIPTDERNIGPKGHGVVGDKFGSGYDTDFSKAEFELFSEDSRKGFDNDYIKIRDQHKVNVKEKGKSEADDIFDAQYSNLKEKTKSVHYSTQAIDKLQNESELTGGTVEEARKYSVWSTAEQYLNDSQKEEFAMVKKLDQLNKKLSSNPEDELTIKEQKAAEKELYGYRLDVLLKSDERITELTRDFNSTADEEEKDLIKEEIQKEKWRNQRVLEPSKAASVITGQLSLDIPGSNPEEKLENYYIGLVERYNELVKNKSLEAFSSSVPFVNIATGSDAVQEIAGVQEKIEEIAPVVLLNKADIKEDNFISNVGKSALGIISDASPLSNEQEQVSTIMDALNISGVDDGISEEARKNVDLMQKTNLWERSGMTVGTVGGIIPQMIGGGYVMGKIPQVGKAVDKILKANKYTKKLSKPIQAGLRYEASSGFAYSEAGQDEASFWSGMLGEGAARAMGKLAKPFYNGALDALGGKTAKSIHDYFTRHIGAGFGELTEESVQELTQIVSNSDGTLADVMHDVEKQFGEVDQVVEFAVSTFVMGMVMGSSSKHAAMSAGAYETMTPEQKKQFDEITGEMTEGVQEAANETSTEVPETIEKEEVSIPKTSKPKPKEEVVEPKKEEIKPTEEEVVEEDDDTSNFEEVRKAGKYKKDGVEYVRKEPISEDKMVVGSDNNDEFAKGVVQPTKYVAIEVEDLHPSHIKGAINRNHFIPEAQPKSRDDQGSIKSAQDIANNPDFERISQSPNPYSGAPIVNDRGEVIQGNNRSDGLYQHYQAKGDKYKKDLLANADKFGLDATKLANMQSPILAKMAKVEDSRAIELGNYDVKDIETGGARRIEPAAVSNRIPQEKKAAILKRIKGEGTLNSRIRTNSEDIIKLIGPALNEAQLNTIMDKGTGGISSKGAQDLEDLVKSFIFTGAPSETRTKFDNLSNKTREGISKAVADIFDVPSGQSLIRDTQRAIEVLSDFESSGVEGFDNWVAQEDMFDGSKSSQYGDLPLGIAKQIADGETQKDISQIFRNYKDLVSGKAADLIEGAKEGVTKAEAVKQLFGIDYEETSTDRSETLTEEERITVEEETGVTVEDLIDADNSLTKQLEEQIKKSKNEKVQSSSEKAVPKKNKKRKKTNRKPSPVKENEEVARSSVNQIIYNRDQAVKSIRANYASKIANAELIEGALAGDKIKELLAEEVAAIAEAESNDYSSLPRKSKTPKPKTQDSGPKPIGEYDSKKNDKRIQPALVESDPNDLKSIFDIIEDLAVGLKASISNTNPQRSRSLGSYNFNDSIIRMRKDNDLGVIAHEIGHLIDHKSDIYSKITNEVGKELVPNFSKYGSTPPKESDAAQKKEYIIREGIAEFIRAYIINAEETKTQAPLMTDLFESSIDENVKTSLDTFSKDILTLYNSTSIEKLNSNTQFMAKDEKGANLKKMVSKTKLMQTFVDDKYAAKKAWEMMYDAVGVNISELEPNQDFSIKSRLFSRVSNKIRGIIEDGMVTGLPTEEGQERLIDEKTGDVVTPKWFMSSLDNSSMDSLESEIKLTIGWMIAQRTIEKGVQLDKEADIVMADLFGESNLDVAKGAIDQMSDIYKNNPKKAARIMEAARRYRVIADSLLRYAVNKGRMSEEQYNEIRENNQYYVAMQRVMNTNVGEDWPSDLSMGVSDLGKTKSITQKFKGSTKAIQDPISSLYEQVNKIVSETDRNEVMQIFTEPYRMLTSENYKDSDPIIQEINAGDMGNSNKDRMFMVYVDGKPSWYLINDKDVARSINGFMKSFSPRWLKNISFARILRMTVTTFPLFAINNLIRDTTHRLVISRHSSNPLDYVGTTKNFKASEKQLRLFGGDLASYYTQDHKSYYKMQRQAMEELANKGDNILLHPKYFLKKASTAYHNTLSKSEMFNRVAEYRAAKKYGKDKLGYDAYNSELYASAEAIRLLDFSQAGTLTRIVNDIIPFTNAGVQGLYRTMESIRENPVKFATKFTMFALVPELMFYGWNLANGDDEEYAEQPSYLKDMFYSVKISGKWVRIPKAFELGIISSLSRRGLDAYRGDERAFNGYSSSAAHIMTPVNETNFLGPLIGAVTGAAANKDFFRGKEIVPYYEDKLKIDHENRKSERGSRLGQAIQEVAGIDSRKIDFIIRSTTSYYGNLGIKISDIGREEKQGIRPLGAMFFDSPVAHSRTVQYVKDIAQKEGIPANSKYMRRLNEGIGEYYNTTDPKLKKELGDKIIERAKEIADAYDKAKETESGIFGNKELKYELNRLDPILE